MGSRAAGRVLYALLGIILFTGLSACGASLQGTVEDGSVTVDCVRRPRIGYQDWSATDSSHVRITGSVVKPGDYPYEEGLTLGALITKAGGLTQDSSADWATGVRPAAACDLEIRVKHRPITLQQTLVPLSAGDWVHIPER